MGNPTLVGVDSLGDYTLSRRRVRDKCVTTLGGRAHADDGTPARQPRTSAAASIAVAWTPDGIDFVGHSKNRLRGLRARGEGVGLIHHYRTIPLFDKRRLLFFLIEAVPICTRHCEWAAPHDESGHPQPVRRNKRSALRPATPIFHCAGRSGNVWGRHPKPSLRTISGAMSEAHFMRPCGAFLRTAPALAAATAQ